MKAMRHTLRVGIVGAGLIGRKREEAVRRCGSGEVVAVADPDFDAAKQLAASWRGLAVSDWRKIVARNDLDAVIVAVPNVSAGRIVIEFLRHGTNVLVEKPLGINVKEARSIVREERKAHRVVQVGFNHRFHRAVVKAHEIVMKQGIGKLFLIRARYGHGGRPGMEREWRLHKRLSGGGELLDQGIHLVDLARWFGGEPTAVYGLAQTKFWRTQLEDNALAIMRNKTVTTSFHVSTTNWKNVFSFELFGEDGYLQIDGKGGSYGEEILTYGRRRPGVAPDVKIFRYPGPDTSWESEWRNFVGAIAGRNALIGTSTDGLRANQIMEVLYRSSREHRELKIRLT